MTIPSLAIREKSALKERIQSIIDQTLIDARPETILQGISASVDDLLVRIWKALKLPPSAALVAVGGYGRNELFPHSDVDVLILLASDPDPILRGKLEELVQCMWDSGLQAGHSIRTIAECLTESASDITVQTSLLEARLVFGNQPLFETMQARFAEHLDVRRFYREKILEMRHRHAKYEDTPFSLEPNCKESPGGLRDLQMILWVARAAGFGNSWRRLASRGFITSTEARQLNDKERLLKALRIRLHLATGRREDRLLFDVQNTLALSVGLHDTELRRASEYMMQRFYLAAKAITQLNTILLQNIEAVLFPQPVVPQPINARFTLANSLIDIAHPDVFKETPSAMLELFLLMTQHSEIRDMTARTRRELWHGRFGIDHAFRLDPDNRRLFMQILQAPRGVMTAVLEMNETSILGRYLPNFRRIVGQMQHDLFHVYTVDQHILMVMRNVQRFTASEHSHEYPFCSELIADFGRPWLLYIAALFHDIAKGRGGDHSELGMNDARQFCEHHFLNQDDTNLVVFLVERHLAMSHVAQKRDLSDPNTIQTFADLVGNERYLTALYLLTVADIRGTSPKVWNGWKGKLLEDLYRMTMRVIGGEAPSADRELQKRQREAQSELRLHGLPDSLHKTFWDQLDVSYFLRHDAGEIAWHTRAFAAASPAAQMAEPMVRCRLSPGGTGLQVAVYTRDQNDLFLRICGYFDQNNFGVLDAKIQTSRNGFALDTFMITAAQFTEHYRSIISLIEHQLARQLGERGDLPDPVKARVSRQSRSFPITPTVDLRPDDRGRYYLLQITANDRNGLLYAIAGVLAKYRINLITAKIMTLGERAEDVFLVDGSTLSHTRIQIAFETELLQALQI